MTRGATLFSGGGGVEALLKHHINFVHAVEYDPAIAAVYRQNHGDHVQVAKVEDVDYSLWGQLDYLHASPVCKNASQAKTGGEESDGDLSSAMAVVRCLEATQPRVFTLENVWGYRSFGAFKLICQALDRMGYMWHFEHLNAADFGVPQTRRRLILRAVRDSLLPGWPAPVPWVGWYAAIEDLIPGLPASQFAPWQLARLPESITGALGLLVHHSEMRSEAQARPDEPAFTVMTHAKMHRAFIMEGNSPTTRAPLVAGTDDPYWTVRAASYKGFARAFILDGQTNDNGALLTVRHGQQPMYTLSASANKRPARAWFVNEDSKMGVYADDAPAPTQISSARARKARALLVDGDGNRSREPTVLDQDDPSMTIQAWHGRRPIQTPRAWLSSGRVVKMTPRALARFQSLPDSYILPEKASLACTVIGNMVPSLLMQQIVEPLL